MYVKFRSLSFSIVGITDKQDVPQSTSQLVWSSRQPVSPAVMCFLKESDDGVRCEDALDLLPVHTCDPDSPHLVDIENKIPDKHIYLSMFSALYFIINIIVSP